MALVEPPKKHFVSGLKREFDKWHLLQAYTPSRSQTCGRSKFHRVQVENEKLRKFIKQVAASRGFRSQR